MAGPEYQSLLTDLFEKVGNPVGYAKARQALALAMFDIIEIDFSKYSSGYSAGSGRGTFALAFTMGAVAACRHPTLAVIKGICVGGGLEIALACHARVLGKDARVGLPEVKLGLLPGAGGTQRLPRAVGKSKAMDMLLTARMMGAEEAERAGLVSRVVPDDQLLTEALAAAETKIGRAHV